ncbi:MAG: UDP-2,4-diacetamido-2,4,6-trideoxy-beta-L-altropyranose hydrolase [Desulfobulbus sp.]|nr:UDP-2,4-diacetamido-2,4,6-trideoxy-beta-L-altropyranose hydrolase [Desulfobulbus sp.]
MKVVFRVDASIQIGSGHVMRCLTLAEALRGKSATVIFICRELPGNLLGYIEEKGFLVHQLPVPKQVAEHLKGTKHANWLGVPWQTDAREVLEILESEYKPDWLVVDHYALDRAWETQILPHVGKIMVIDDLADRRHDCDLLLDQNLYDKMEERYDNLVSKDCKKLLGPRYALLRKEFHEVRKALRERDGIIKRILIFFGAVDKTNETEKALHAVLSLNKPDMKIDVVVGSANSHKDKIKAFCQKIPNATYFCQVDNIAELMASADLAIGAGGTTTWERCYLELPSITIVVAENQEETSRAVAAVGASVVLGHGGEVKEETIANEINLFLANIPFTKEMGKRAGELMGERLESANCYVVSAILEGQLAAL